MSFDKSIKYGKEKRKPYTGAKAVDRTCRNHGSCDYCKAGRLYQFNRKKEAAVQQEKEYYSD